MRTAYTPAACRAPAPADAATVRVTIAGETHELAVQPNSCAALAGRRLLFTVNRDNELGWIREWAEYHQRAHGTDAVIVVDNGSSRYDAAELRATLAAVPGIGDVAVPSWPYSFGPIDPAVTGNPYWARFLQIGSMSVVLRRYGEAAFGLLDCDIDELAGTLSGGERAMLVLGRALMGKPRVLMLDEPSLLAPLIVRDIFRIISDLRDSGVAILHVEQNARAALRISDYGYVLETGSVALEGNSRDLEDDPRVLATYLGGSH